MLKYLYKYTNDSSHICDMIECDVIEECNSSMLGGWVNGEYLIDMTASNLTFNTWPI